MATTAKAVKDATLRHPETRRWPDLAMECVCDFCCACAASTVACLYNFRATVIIWKRRQNG